MIKINIIGKFNNNFMLIDFLNEINKIIPTITIFTVSNELKILCVEEENSIIWEKIKDILTKYNIKKDAIEFF